MRNIKFKVISTYNYLVHDMHLNIVLLSMNVTWNIALLCQNFHKCVNKEWLLMSSSPKYIVRIEVNRSPTKLT